MPAEKPTEILKDICLPVYESLKGKELTKPQVTKILGVLAESYSTFTTADEWNSVAAQIFKIADLPPGVSNGNIVELSMQFQKLQTGDVAQINTALTNYLQKMNSFAFNFLQESGVIPGKPGIKPPTMGWMIGTGLEAHKNLWALYKVFTSVPSIAEMDSILGAGFAALSTGDLKNSIRLGQIDSEAARQAIRDNGYLVQSKSKGRGWFGNTTDKAIAKFNAEVSAGKNPVDLLGEHFKKTAEVRAEAVAVAVTPIAAPAAEAQEEEVPPPPPSSADLDSAEARVAMLKALADPIRKEIGLSGFPAGKEAVEDSTKDRLALAAAADYSIQEGIDTKSLDDDFTKILGQKAICRGGDRWLLRQMVTATAAGSEATKILQEQNETLLSKINPRALQFLIASRKMFDQDVATHPDNYPKLIKLISLFSNVLPVSDMRKALKESGISLSTKETAALKKLILLDHIDDPFVRELMAQNMGQLKSADRHVKTQEQIRLFNQEIGKLKAEGTFTFDKVQELIGQSFNRSTAKESNPTQSILFSRYASQYTTEAEMTPQLREASPTLAGIVDNANNAKPVKPEEVKATEKAAEETKTAEADAKVRAAKAEAKAKVEVEAKAKVEVEAEAKPEAKLPEPAKGETLLSAKDIKNLAKAEAKVATTIQSISDFLAATGPVRDVCVRDAKTGDITGVDPSKVATLFKTFGEEDVVKIQKRYLSMLVQLNSIPHNGDPTTEIFNKLQQLLSNTERGLTALLEERPKIEPLTKEGSDAASKIEAIAKAKNMVAETMNQVTKRSEKGFFARIFYKPDSAETQRIQIYEAYANAKKLINYIQANPPLTVKEWTTVSNRVQSIHSELEKLNDAVERSTSIGGEQSYLNKLFKDIQDIHNIADVAKQSESIIANIPKSEEEAGTRPRSDSAPAALEAHAPAVEAGTIEKAAARSRALSVSEVTPVAVKAAVEAEVTPPPAAKTVEVEEPAEAAAPPPPPPPPPVVIAAPKVSSPLPSGPEVEGAQEILDAIKKLPIEKMNFEQVSAVQNASVEVLENLRERNLPEDKARIASMEKVYNDVQGRLQDLVQAQRKEAVPPPLPPRRGASTMQILATIAGGAFGAAAGFAVANVPGAIAGMSVGTAFVSKMSEKKPAAGPSSVEKLAEVAAKQPQLPQASSEGRGALLAAIQGGKALRHREGPAEGEKVSQATDAQAKTAQAFTEKVGAVVERLTGASKAEEWRKAQEKPRGEGEVKENEWEEEKEGGPSTSMKGLN